MPSKVPEREPFKESEPNALTFKKDDPRSFNKKPTNVFSNTNFRTNKNDWHWIHSDEPHTTRRKEILKAHPEIKKLFGPEIKTFYIVMAIVLAQLWVCSWIGNSNWLVYILMTYIFCGTVNHSLQLANHEISHNLVFKSLTKNFILGIIANLPTGVPSSVTFRYYHMDHHIYQGVSITDTDIPCDFELKYFRTTIMKFIWMLGQALAYALRPMYLNPKPLTKEQIFNALACFIYDYIIYIMFGKWALIYMIVGSVIGLGLHPCAGHFIAEHYEFVKGYETYSYYGWCNYLNFNVGYHNEHHDFPKIAWSNLSKVKEIAPEWYQHLPQHNSYIKVIYKYITDDNIGPWSRVKRNTCSKHIGHDRKKHMIVS